MCEEAERSDQVIRLVELSLHPEPVFSSSSSSSSSSSVFSLFLSGRGATTEGGKTTLLVSAHVEMCLIS